MKATDQPVTPATLPYYARTNEAFLDGAPRGIALEFPGLGGGSCLGGQCEVGDYDTPFARECAANGIVLAYLFTGPWSWMNKGAVALTDAVVDALREKHGLTADAPLVATGGSMGGLGALIYAADTRHRVTAIASVCPCLDVPAAYDCLPSFPMTFYRAVAEYDIPFTDALRSLSPVHRLADIPVVPVLLICDGADELFPRAECERYAGLLRAHGCPVDYRLVEDGGHGAVPADVRAVFDGFVIRYAAR